MIPIIIYSLPYPMLSVLINNKIFGMYGFGFSKNYFSIFILFLFTDFFKTKVTKDQFQVLFEVIKVSNSTDIRKGIHIQNFFQNYPSILDGK